MSDFTDHCQKIVQRFLLTAIVVDDELSLSRFPPAHGDLILPSSSTVISEQGQGNEQTRSLKVDQITASFLREGMICGVVSPQEDNFQALAETVSCADIIILDWRLSRRSGKDALPLLKEILSGSLQHQLRLIAIYTGENDPREILKQIVRGIDGLGADDLDGPTGHDSFKIDFGACRIVIYLKEDTRTTSENSIRIVNEEKLPSRLISDFADKVEGLLPGVVLTALTAVRENVYRVIERFGSVLDPAFLTHRVCLPQPQESEQHIVEQITSELYGIMDDAIDTEVSPAGIQVIKYWFDKQQFQDGQVSFGPRDKHSVDEVLGMLEHGIENKDFRLIKPQKFDNLSRGFSKGAEDSGDLDHRLAWAMSFRQILDQKQRQLTMGTVISQVQSASAEYLLCITPKCDSVRLTETTSFLFLSLSDPATGKPKLVVPIGENGYQLMSISMKPSDWRIMNFKPNTNKKRVLADRDESDHIFTFQDAEDQEYQWVGELKPEFAQSIAQKFSESISRIPLNQSEWLRRSGNKG